jgi:GR25 family glycosyltransferase involved in LPS biosynthesis
MAGAKSEAFEKASAMRTYLDGLLQHVRKSENGGGDADVTLSNPEQMELACQARSAAFDDALLNKPSTAKAPSEDDSPAPLSLLHQVHLINLDRSVERLEKFRQRNSHLDNVLRIRAVDGTSIDRNLLMQEGVITEDLSYPPGSLGCALSHLNLWKKAVSENRIVTIFEDDVICADRFQEESTELISRLRDDWDIVQWGYLFWRYFVWLDFGFAKAKVEFYDRSFSEDRSRFQSASVPRSLVRTAYVLGAQAYTVSPKGARALLEYCLPLRKRFIPFPGTGVVIEDIGIDGPMCGAYSSMQAFTCVPPLVIPDDEQPSEREELNRTVATADTGTK